MRACAHARACDDHLCSGVKFKLICDAFITVNSKWALKIESDWKSEQIVLSGLMVGQFRHSELLIRTVDEGWGIMLKI